MSYRPGPRDITYKKTPGNLTSFMRGFKLWWHDRGHYYFKNVFSIILGIAIFIFVVSSAIVLDMHMVMTPVPRWLTNTNLVSSLSIIFFVLYILKRFASMLIAKGRQELMCD